VDTRVVTRLTTWRAITVQRHWIFLHLENGRKRCVYVYCENSEDLSVNFIETLLERSGNNTVLLSR
jgi:hypothetical protein